MILLKNASKEQANYIARVVGDMGVYLETLHPSGSYFVIFDKKMLDLAAIAMKEFSRKVKFDVDTIYELNVSKEEVIESCNVFIEYLEESTLNRAFDVGGKPHINRNIEFNSWQLFYYGDESHESKEIDPIIQSMCKSLHIQYYDIAADVFPVHFQLFDTIKRAIQEYSLTTYIDQDRILSREILYLLSKAEACHGSDVPYEYFLHIEIEFEIGRINLKSFQAEALHTVRNFDVDKWGTGFIDKLCRIIQSESNGELLEKKINFMLDPNYVSYWDDDDIKYEMKRS